MFKKSLLTATMAALLIGGASFVAAQDSSQGATAAPQAQEGRSGHHHREMDPAKRTQHLTKKLNLSSEQQSKVQSLLQDEQSQMQNLRQDTSTPKEDRRAKFMEIHKNTDDQIRAALNADQQKKWDEMRSKREEHMQKHHGGAMDQGGSSQPQ